MEQPQQIEDKLKSIADPLALLASLFANAPIGLQIFRADGRCVFTNQTFRDLVGAEPPPEYNVLEDEFAEKRGMLHLIRRAFAGETIRVPAFWFDPAELTRFKTPGAKRAAISCITFPLFNADGGVGHVVILYRDETEAQLTRERLAAERDALEAAVEERLRLAGERDALLERLATAAGQAEEQRARLQSLFMQAPFAIAIQKGPELVYELANSRYRRYLGDRDLVGKPRRAILPDDAKLTGILDGVYRTGEPFAREDFSFQVIRTGSEALEEAFFNFICQPTRDASGRIDGVVTFAVEVTEQVLARRSVEGLAADLSRNVELLKQVESELQEAVRIRDSFLSIASHELKTPLTALQLQVDSLLRSARAAQIEPLPPERVARRADAIRRQSERLGKLIDELLDVSRITAGHLALELEPIDLAAIVDEVVGRLAEERLFSHSPVTVRVDRQTVGRWDRLRLEQVVVNLVSNALKYGAGKPVEILVEKGEGGARLTVRDEGIGIGPEDQVRIFERFERATSERHYGGFGLGLWIARQIVEAHGGRIHVESRPGEGSTFVVELPLDP